MNGPGHWYVLINRKKVEKTLPTCQSAEKQFK